MKLSTFSNDKNNNFNLIRMMAALMVLVAHSYTLSTGDSKTEPLKQLLFGTSLGTVAVHIFFITSGFLISMSLTRNQGLLQYAANRCLRIFPGLVTALIITTLTLGLAASELPFQTYITSPDTIIYLVKNSILIFGIAHNLPETFVNNPYPGAVNGSLWTLPYELRMYILIAAIYLLCKRAYTKHISVLIFLAAFILKEQGLFISSSLHKLVELCFFFMLGSLIFQFQNHIKLTPKLTLISITLLIISPIHEFSFKTIYPISLAYCVFAAAYLPKGKLLNYNQLGDYSYGLYIYAFPVQQLIALSIESISIIEMIIFSTITTIPLAIASWHLIEKPSLKLKRLFAYRKDKPQ